MRNSQNHSQCTRDLSKVQDHQPDKTMTRQLDSHDSHFCQGCRAYHNYAEEADLNIDMPIPRPFPLPTAPPKGYHGPALPPQLEAERRLLHEQASMTAHQGAQGHVKHFVTQMVDELMTNTAHTHHHPLPHPAMVDSPFSEEEEDYDDEDYDDDDEDDNEDKDESQEGSRDYYDPHEQLAFSRMLAQEERLRLDNERMQRLEERKARDEERRLKEEQRHREREEKAHVEAVRKAEEDKVRQQEQEEKDRLHREKLQHELKRKRLIAEADQRCRSFLFHCARKGQLETVKQVMSMTPTTVATEQDMAKQSEPSVLLPMPASANALRLDVWEYSSYQEGVGFVSDEKGTQMTLLHAAVASGCAPLVDYLIAQGAPLSAVDKDGAIPLHTLALQPAPLSSSALAIGSALINAAPHLVDYPTIDSGRNALHIAADYGHHDLVHLLLTEGKARLTFADLSGVTAESIASRNLQKAEAKGDHKLVKAYKATLQHLQRAMAAHLQAQKLREGALSEAKRREEELKRQEEEQDRQARLRREERLKAELKRREEMEKDLENIRLGSSSGTGDRKKKKKKKRSSAAAEAARADHPVESSNEKVVKILQRPLSASLQSTSNTPSSPIPLQRIASPSPPHKTLGRPPPLSRIQSRPNSRLSLEARISDASPVVTSRKLSPPPNPTTISSPPSDPPLSADFYSLPIHANALPSPILANNLHSPARSVLSSWPTDPNEAISPPAMVRTPSLGRNIWGAGPLSPAIHEDHPSSPIANSPFVSPSKLPEESKQAAEVSEDNDAVRGLLDMLDQEDDDDDDDDDRLSTPAKRRHLINEGISSHESSLLNNLTSTLGLTPSPSDSLSKAPSNSKHIAPPGLTLFSQQQEAGYSWW